MSTEPQQSLAPTAHHPLGPSQWPAFAECADFEAEPDVDLDDIDVDEEDMSAKARGTAMHKALAMLLGGDLGMRQRAFDGLNDREREMVQWTADKVLQIAQENGYTAADIVVEQRVTMLKPDSFAPLYFGTCDVEIGGIIDIDAKFGLQRNYFPQIVGYALPKLEQRNQARRIGYFVYGRLKRVERFVIDRRTAETVAYGLLNRRLSPHRKPTACSYCGWCAKKATCAAFVAEPVALVARREDWALKLPSPHVSQLHDPAWMGAARFIWKNYLEKWGKAIEFASSSMAAAGHVVPAGYFKRPEKGRTTIKDKRKAFEALRETVGEDVLWDSVDLAIGTLAKAYGDSAGISEEKAKGIITSKLADARALQVGEPTFKLIAEKNAEDIIRSALAIGGSRVHELPESGQSR
jgi:hypothetical protein